ncbi:E3 ubiquitin-protein ligase RNF213-like isoform X3 [Lithobates pipiens]
MKCHNCGHEPKEEQPKFCSECGTRLLVPVQSTGNQGTTTITTHVGGEQQYSDSLNHSEDGKELKADITKTTTIDDQSKISEDERLLPLIKSQEERNGRSEKDTSNDSEPTAASTLFPTGVNDSNTIKSDEYKNGCKSLEDRVTVTVLPAHDGDSKALLEDETNSSNIQEGKVTICNDVPLQHEHVRDNVEKLEASKHTNDEIAKNAIDPEIVNISTSNINTETVQEEQASANENKNDDLEEEKMDISSENEVNKSAEVPEQAISVKEEATRQYTSVYEPPLPKKTGDKEKQDPAARDTEPSNYINVYFHVIVSKNFNVNTYEDKVVVKAGCIKGYQGWLDVLCEMTFKKKIGDLGLLYEGYAQISKDCLDKYIPYKYLIVRKSGEEDYEYIHYVQANSHINRCLHIHSKYVYEQEWHQYDDVCIKKDHWLVKTIKNTWTGGYKSIIDLKIAAGKVMLHSLFNILSSCDDINLSNFFDQLHQFYAVYVDPLLFGQEVIQWKNLGFGVHQVHCLILEQVMETCNSFLHRKTMIDDDIKRRLMAGMICVCVITIYSISTEKTDLQNICSVVCMEEMPEEKIIKQIQKTKLKFSRISWLHQHLRLFCQQCIDLNVGEWIWVLPVLHIFSPLHNPETSRGTTMHNQEDIWAGLEGLAYHKMKKQSSILPKMTAKKYLLKVDPTLIQSWLCLVPINYMVTFLKTFPVKIVDALQACFFKVHAADLPQKQNIEDILKESLQIIERQEKIPSEQEFHACCKISLALHNRICSSPSLQACYQLPVLSAKIILMLLYLSGSLHHYTEADAEAVSQLTDRKDVLQEAQMLTRKWLKNVYGARFNEWGRPAFNIELLVWNQILTAGDNVTPKWKDALLPDLRIKIKQEEAVEQISLYCKRQNDFKTLDPCINKCFEDCAIDAVHLACQKTRNILSYLNPKTLGNFGLLLSSVIKNSWPRDDQGNHVKDSGEVLEHLLKWPDATYMFKLYGTDIRVISQFGEDIQELVVLSESVFLGAVTNVMNGEVLFQHIESILQHREQFVAICQLKRADVPSLREINKVLDQRKAELDMLQKERDVVDSLLKMFQRIDQYIKVNIVKIKEKHSEELGPQKLSNILPVEIFDTPKDFTELERSYYNLCPRLMIIAKELHTFRNSHISITCWERRAQALAENSHKESSEESEAEVDDDSEDNDNDVEFTSEEIMDKLFTPCLEECRTIYGDLKSGEVTFEVVDTFLSDFKNNYKKMENEFKILCRLGAADYGRWISKCVKQIEQYHQLDVAFRSAKVIFDVKTLFKLSGDFKTLETLLQFAEDFESCKQKPLSFISKEVVKARKHLSQMKEDHIECLNEVLLRAEFCNWVKDSLEDVNELKVFVDLASISAGENDMDVDRVACFHDTVLGYSPLLYDLKPDFNFDSFMKCLEKLWKALKSDQNLPTKLRDSARHIHWLKTVKESHGSVELSSLSLATSINKKGIYLIRVPKDNKKITLDSVLQLQLPVTGEGTQNMRCYTLEDLKELLNKLMLMSGKGDQGNSEVVKFSEVFSKVQRVTGLFIDLYVAGNMLFRTWEVKIYCSDESSVGINMKFGVDGIDELEEHGILTDLLPDISNTIERLLEEWLDFVKNKRSQLYYLNYYTAEQLVYLCQQYQKRDISEEALLMLSFIKPIISNIDIINSGYSQDTNSLNETSWVQPDIMKFSNEFQDCTTVVDKLELIWKFYMNYTSSLFPECLDLDTLGKSLAALATLDQETVKRELHPSLEPNKPNLILCSASEMWSSAIAVYMVTSDQPQPSYDEVLLCKPCTTFEEVALFLRRCMTPGYNGNKIYSLIYADQLSYDVAYKSEQLFQQLQSQGMKSYNLVIICNSDREHCYIPSVFSQFKVHVIPQRPLKEIQHYVFTHFKVDPKVVTAASVFKDRMSAGIVSSKRAGVGKSLYVKRLYQNLVSTSPGKKPLLKIIRLIKPEVDESQVLEALLPYLKSEMKNRPILFHIDITSSVNSGIAEFLFKLLFLQYLTGSEGRMWKRLPNHLYIIEILESSDSRNQFKSVPGIMQTNVTEFFPKILCSSPKEVLTRNTENEERDGGDPGMDMEEFHSEYFQRPYQYLTRFDQKENLDTFVYKEGHVEKDPARCLQIFLLYCGIVDPSWSELRNFAWFLNIQLKDCESSVFCKPEIVKDTLQGLKTFVVNFMILMAKDFATPSLNIADQSPGRKGINLDGVKEEDLVPFLLRKRWESEPHPYVFFNDDHESMTFLGFHLKQNKTGGVDAINPRNNSIIRQNVMSSNLHLGLRVQRVKFNIDFDQLPRHKKINSLCMVLGIQWPMDPDETYELTMDNMLKILAIKMRFRCGIPVVIMGETGCGKTRLIKFLCQLCKGFVETENLKLVKVHGGTTAEMIYQNILEAQEIARVNKEKGCETVLFFDEANTTEAISSIKEALCDRTVNGVPLDKDSGLHIIAACNPYRKHSDDMIKRLESAGLGYRVRADETKERLGSIPLRQLVYRVHALPPSMMPLVWDFGQLNNETEWKYIQQIVVHLAKEIQLSTTDVKLMTNVLSASQSHMREKKDECSFVSLRDVERCIEVFKWFYSHHEKITMQYESMLQKGMCSFSVNKITWSLLLAIGVCYHASLETKDAYRNAICKCFPQPYNNPDTILNTITAVQDLFLAGVQIGDTIARNLALKENLFMMVICIELKIPLFLVGKPGSSKSLAKTIVADAMQGQAAHTELYKDLKQIHLVSFQCSPHSTPEGIIGTFRHCARFQEGKDLTKYVSVVVLDEIGLAEDSTKMPLKTLHPLLEDGCIDDDTSPHKKVGFIGISNWALDPAKMNRGIFVSRGDPDEKELVNSAKGICSSESLVLQQHFSSFAEAYLEVCNTQKEQKREYFGLRDFYSLIKMVFAFSKESQENLTLENIARAVLRNFSGKDEVNALAIFLKDKTKNITPINTIDLVMENINSESDDCRYLLILTKNYSALQILQQVFRENQQPEIIFGSSFPKDQEYTQVCQNINRIKICMETGKMVILLNLQNLYESLYDALNQYYVCLAGQKYVDLGLGTHRVKCRVHPKFRLIVIEEKEVVYKDFPIPLINRLEKHYVDINTYLKKEHNVIVEELEAWVRDFTNGNSDQTMGKAQTYMPSDVFIGYHSNTCASVVLQVTENMKESHPDAESAIVMKKAQHVLLNCATPDSVVRLGKKDLIVEYFKKQKHGSLLDFLSCQLQIGSKNHANLTEITTFSRLLTSADKKILEAELSGQVNSIEILSLQHIDTELSFLKKIWSFLNGSSGNLVLIIQTDFEEGPLGANLVASAKYCAMNEIHKVNLTDVSVFVYFITKLPRMLKGSSYVGFRGGLWQSVHIDDLRKSKDMVTDITEIQNLTISQLFDTEGEPVMGSIIKRQDIGTEMDIKMGHGSEKHEIHPTNNVEERASNDIPEDQEIKTEGPKTNCKNILDTTTLIRSCIQNAIGLLRDDKTVASRSTKRIEILIKLLSTEDQIKGDFLQMLKRRLHGMLKVQEENTYQAAEWVVREASDQDALHEAGTFRQTLWKRVQTVVTPLLSQILSVLDHNANLDLLVDENVEDYLKSLWMYIFHDESLLPISNKLHSSKNKIILVDNYMNICNFGSNALPFSWRIKDSLEDIWTQVGYMGHKEGPEMQFLDMFSQTQLGKYISSQKENQQNDIFLYYQRDFILMTMNISSDKELQVMEFALSSCIEELRFTRKTNELPLPLVHIGYSTFQHRLQNLSRILFINPSVVQHLIEKIEDPQQMRKNEMVLDIFAAIACLETLKQTVHTLNAQEWMQKVKNIQMPIELICSEGYLQECSAWCKTGIRQIRSYWNCVFSMALFLEHLLTDENLQDAEMKAIITGHTIFLGRLLQNFPEMKTERPLMAVVDVLQRCRDATAKSVSRFGLQVCAVCQEEPNEPVCLNCDHVFCQSCLRQWLDTGKSTCPMCNMQLPEPFVMVVSTEISDSMNKYNRFRRQCNEFFVNFICNLCFKDNTSPDNNVIRHLLSFLFNGTESENYTKALSPFADAVDTTPVIRSVILKLLLKYSFKDIMKYAEDYLRMLEEKNLLKLEDTREVCLLFINSLEDSLLEKKQKVQSEIERNKYLDEEVTFMKTYFQNIKQQTQDEKSVYFFQDVARLRVALATAAEMLSLKSREAKNDQYLKYVMDFCSQSGNDWYRIYIIRKLANLDGIDAVQTLSEDPESEWLFPWKMLQNEDAETGNIDQFLVCGDSYKVLRDGIARGMIECKQQWIETAVKECGCQDQELTIYLLLAVFREITLYYGAQSHFQQAGVPELESVKTFIKDVGVFTEGSLNKFLQTLLNNNRPYLQSNPGMTGLQSTIFGLAIHMAAILLSGNNSLFAPLKNMSFFPSRMQNSFLPTMPEDMFAHAEKAVTGVQWYLCSSGHYCAVGECGLPMQAGQCLDCGANVGGFEHVPLVGCQRLQHYRDRTQTGHVLGASEHQGPAVAPDRDIAAPAFILLRMITHLAMLLGSEEDSENIKNIVKPAVDDVTSFCFHHIEKDLEYLKNSLGKSVDDTTTVVHLVFCQMMNLQKCGHPPVNTDDVWLTKEMRNNWEKHFSSYVIAPVLRNLDMDLMTLYNYISQDERISSNPLVKVVYGDPLTSGENLEFPKDSNVHCSKIWSCREQISIEYILHAVQQKDGTDNLHLLCKFLEKETELQMVKFLPDILKLQKELVKKFQNYKYNSFETIRQFVDSITPDGNKKNYMKYIEDYMLAWNHLRFSLQTNGEIKLPEGMGDQILTIDSDFEFLLPRRQGLGLGATALTSYLIALHNSFIHELEKHTKIEQKYSIKASDVMDIHVISYEKERDIIPIVLSNCQYSLESGKETLQEFDFSKIQHQLTIRLFQGKPLITMVGLPTLTLSRDRNYENLFTDVKKKLPQHCLSNSAINAISKDLNAFSDVCEALTIVDISLGFLATSGGDPEVSLTQYVENVLQMGEQSSEHVLQALKRCCLKNTVALWQLLTALKSQHLLHMNKDPFADVDKAFKQKLNTEEEQALNMFLEQNGTKFFLLKLHETIMLNLRGPKSTDVFRPPWSLKDVLINLLDEKEIPFLDLEKNFPEQIELAHCVETWKIAATKKLNRALTI